VIGTLIGGAIATAVVLLIRDPYVYGALGVASLVISLALVQRNNRAAATFITLSVVFIYALLQPDVLSAIKFRVLDTIVGAGLSYAAMLWLWPAWEFVEIKKSIEKSVRANKEFLQAIIAYYQRKGTVPATYTLARKEAFLETSNLNSAFQRMAQEPRSKQRNIDETYELVVLNHEFLASLASLSTYIQDQRTTEASEQFRIATGSIEKNLELVLRCLIGDTGDFSEAFAENNSLFEEQMLHFNTLAVTNLEARDKEKVRDLQEAHLVLEQLQWLFSLSGKMLKLAPLAPATLHLHQQTSEGPGKVSGEAIPPQAQGL
jgi:uncharacterized membrane protein YccC